MYGPPPIMPMVTPAYPPPTRPFGAVPMAGRPAPPVPMMGSGGPPERMQPVPASGGAALAPGAPGLAPIGRLMPMIQSAGKWLPMIQKYGPMVRQIPGMIQKANQVSKALKHASNAKADAPVEEKKEEKQDIEHFSTNQIMEGAQPPPKLYV